MNSVVHFEIPAKDMNRAKTFYKSVFNWSMFDFEDSTSLVSTVDSDDNGIPKVPGAINGSIYKVEGPKTVTIVIDVPDIHAHIKIAEANGGKLVDPVATVPGMGMYARFTDTEGNLIGLWQTI
jgi:uncharacterized protein